MNNPITIDAAVTTAAQVEDQLGDVNSFRVVERTQFDEVGAVVELTGGRLLALNNVDNLELEFQWNDAAGAPTLVLENCRFGDAIDDPLDLFDVGETMPSVGLLHVDIRNCRKADNTAIDDFRGTLVGLLPA
jgi:hypothetical protein